MSGHLSFEEVKRYLQTYGQEGTCASGTSQQDTGGVGALTLAELRSQLHAGDAETEELVQLEARQKDAQRADDLRRLKIRHQKLKSKRHQDLAAVKDLVAELEKRKEAELRIRLERQRLMRSLKKVDKSRLASMEAEKKKELAALAKEKKVLQQREHELMEQVKEIEEKVCQQEEKMQQEMPGKEQRWNADAAAQKQASKYGELLALAKEHGRKVSALASEKQQLMKERSSIQGHLSKNNQDLSAPPPAVDKEQNSAEMQEEELQKLLSEVEQKLPAKQERLQRLLQQNKEDERRREAEKITESREIEALRPPGINKSVPFAMEAREFLDEWLNREKNAVRNSTGVSQVQTKVNAKALDEAATQLDAMLVQEEETDAPKTKSTKPRRKPVAETPAAYSSSPSSTSSPIPSPQRRHSPRPKRSLRRTPRTENRQTKKSTPRGSSRRKDSSRHLDHQHAELLEQIQKLERAIAEQNQSLSSHSPRSGLTPREAVHEAQSSEFSRLEESIMRERREMMQQRTQFSQTLHQIVNKLNTVNQPMPYSYIQPPPNMQSQQLQQPLVTPTAAHGPQGPVDPSVPDPLANLDSIPRDSPLYKMRLRHMEKIIKLKCEAEALVEEQKLSEIREKIRLQKLEHENKAKHEMWKAEQQRKLAEARMKKLLAMENEHLNTEATKASYNPRDGFLLFFDYLIDVPKQFSHLRIAYAFYDGQTPKTKPKALPTAETDKDGPTTCRAIFATHKQFKKIAPLQLLSLVIEVQSIQNLNGRHGNAQVQSIGWTILQLFNDDNQLKEGLIKLPLLQPPMKIQVHTAINECPRIPHMSLFLRNVNACNAQHARGFVVDSNVTQHLYKYPFATQAKEQPLPQAAAPTQAKPKQPPPQPEESYAEPGPPQAAAVEEKQPEEAETAGNDEANRQETAPEEDPRNNELASVGKNSGKLSTDSASLVQSFLIAIKVKQLTLPTLVPSSSLKIRVVLLRDEKRVGYREVCSAEAASQSENYVRVWESPVVVVGESTSVDMDAIAPQDLSAQFEFTHASTIVFEVVQVSLGTDESSEEKEGNPDRSVLGLSGVALSTFTIQDATTPGFKFPAEAIALAVFQPSSDEPFDREVFAPEASSNRLVDQASLIIELQDQPFAVPVPQERLEEELSQEIFEEKASAVSSVIGAETELGGDAWVEAKHHLAEVGRNGVALYNKEEDGFNVYIDGARFLPDNITLSCVQLKCMLPDYSAVGEAHMGYPRFDDSAFSPKYNLRAEFHGATFANPTTTLLIRVDGIDRYTKETVVIGYCALPAFLLADGSGKQPEKSTEQDYHLNAGSFQVALTQQLPPRTLPLSGTFLESLPRVPCATLLIRLLAAEKSEDGLKLLSIKDIPEEERAACPLVVGAPAYESGAYDSVRYANPMRCERTLYRHRSERDDPLIEEVTTLAKRDNVEEDKNVDVMEDEELMEWIKQRLSKPSGFMGIKHAVKYHPEAGFKLTLHAFHDLRTDAILKVVYSLSPPASFYTSPKLTEEVDFSLHADFDAKLHYQRFVEEMHTYRDAPFDGNLIAVFDVKSVHPNKKKSAAEAFSVKDVCWTFLPVFDEVSQTVRSGCYQLPLFEGPPTKEVLDEIYVDGFSKILPTDYAARKKDKLKLLKPGASLVVSLVDTLVADCVKIEPTNDEALLKTYLPSKDAAKYHYQVPTNKGKPLTRLVPKGKGQEEFEKELNLAFGKLMEITHYTL